MEKPKPKGWSSRLRISMANGVFLAGTVAAITAIILTTQISAGDAAVYLTAGAAYATMALTAIRSAAKCATQPSKIKTHATTLMWSMVFAAYTSLAINRHQPEIIPLGDAAIIWTAVALMGANLLTLKGLDALKALKERRTPLNGAGSQGSPPETTTTTEH